MSLLMLVVVLGGCAATDTAQDASGSPLVAYTSVGSQPSQRAEPYTDSGQPRPRALTPIRERPAPDGDAQAVKPAGGSAPRLISMGLNWVGSYVPWHSLPGTILWLIRVCGVS
ncbi:hypothetical protein N7E01_09010 [Neopusillimonas aromaticivorans]|nr:hypothetical protein [Neopusillimonas aromaticivorans]WJJ92520.1 hypothetical protein N7E01_09010 [Neopusillimonas aromaticivorans]